MSQDLYKQVSGMVKPLFLIHFVCENRIILVWVIEAAYICISYNLLNSTNVTCSYMYFVQINERVGPWAENNKRKSLYMYVVNYIFLFITWDWTHSSDSVNVSPLFQNIL